MKNVFYWINDYYYLLLGKLLMYIHQKPPKDYLGYAIKDKNPVILIPGNSNKWGFLKKLADTISNLGHPIYISQKLGLNLFDIPTSAKIVREIIDDNKLENVVLIGHSKGGIVGKYLLIHNNKDEKISKLIAIAAPFSGSRLANYTLGKSFKELSPQSTTILEMKSNIDINSKIVSIMPEFDTRVWHEKGSFLEGALNITVPIKGHHKIVFDKAVISKIIKLL